MPDSAHEEVYPIAAVPAVSLVNSCILKELLIQNCNHICFEYLLSDDHGSWNQNLPVHSQV